MARGKLKTYKVWYSNHSAGKVKAYSITGAKRQAWDRMGGFTYNWSKKDFMRNATVERAD